ncbi:MAG: FKBP-type peptidyl-prolyl cis-trans isomerase [Gammaproteobacteria bacterium]|nr:FKBP-type peptidyl-prolyl cis-trans isomerase [Gammaproteobacteria bacterium]MCP5137549.1 FKBP-type peptidyl-prolyl cis-trans isomerase [Gammaproteobacteria bacterium]
MSLSPIKRALVPVLCLALSAPALATDLTSDHAKYSYTLGYQVAQQLAARGLQVDPAAFADAIEDALGGKPPSLTPEQMQAAIDTARETAAAKDKAIADANSETGKQFQAEYAKQEGVNTLSNGIQYKILKAGDGAKPGADATVVVHYRGTLVDGTEFDSSIARKEPATFPVGNVIPGFSAALQSMPVGSKWEVVIPGDQAYGERGIPDGPIGPNETLIFEIELLEIKA